MKRHALGIATAFVAGILWASMLSPCRALDNYAQVLDRIADALERANQLAQRGCK